MDAIPVEVGSATLYLEPSDVAVERVTSDLLGDDYDGTVESGNLPQQVADGYEQLKVVLTEIMRDISGTMVQQVREQGAGAPRSLELEMSLKFSASANVWVVAASGESGIAARLTWDFTD
ncbi:CU044_2847 family protein [Myceligenerans pegani]|uniref:Trypsin-co-occurring domain-containing protein n=1 Tax=Myceligenerans pegani TaxID=2776917 RepID=A0ABR9N374_9MICO|nr:CU044_2847 family protein [Myceligenerans sp. TRM 65318]MBE1878104.1 hypothetical protein [Myceligenerans sp. TRM 65318]MBE3020375.1 hypothetical protein [Myceligenerans sp. TRM 65318]